MGHPVVVDDELGASPFFLRSLWLTMNKLFLFVMDDAERQGRLW